MSILDNVRQASRAQSRHGDTEVSKETVILKNSYAAQNNAGNWERLITDYVAEARALKAAGCARVGRFGCACPKCYRSMDYVGSSGWRCEHCDDTLYPDVTPRELPAAHFGINHLGARAVSAERARSTVV